MEHYLHQIYLKRRNVSEPDASLELIRRVLFGYFKIPEPKTTPTTDDELKRRLESANPAGEGRKLPRLTAEEVAAWEKAGMPSPFDAWIRSYRDAAKRR